MGIHVADPAAEQPVAFDQLQHLLVRRGARLRQQPKIRQNAVAMPKISHCKLAEDKGVCQNLARFEQRRQCGKPAAKVQRPNRGVDQDHVNRSLCKRSC